jgi:hypothetical protein
VPLLSMANWDPSTTSRLTGESPLGSAGASGLEVAADTCACDAKTLVEARVPSVSRATCRNRDLRRVPIRGVMGRAYLSSENPEMPLQWR